MTRKVALNIIGRQGNKYRIEFQEGDNGTDKFRAMDQAQVHPRLMETYYCKSLFQVIKHAHEKGLEVEIADDE